jgi:hypothetical protein
MSGLREALEAAVGRANKSVSVTVLRTLLAAHPPEPAPVASREAVLQALANVPVSYSHTLLTHNATAGRLAPHAQGLIADALLAAGVFRDESQVKADALEEAAEHIRIPRASSLAAAWLQGRATKLRAGEPS